MNPSDVLSAIQRVCLGMALGTLLLLNVEIADHLGLITESSSELIWYGMGTIIVYTFSSPIVLLASYSIALGRKLQGQVSDDAAQEGGV